MHHSFKCYINHLCTITIYLVVDDWNNENHRPVYIAGKTTKQYYGHYILMLFKLGYMVLKDSVFACSTFPDHGSIFKVMRAGGGGGF